MNGMDLLTYFPLYKGSEGGDIFQSKQEVLFDYNFDESKVFFYRILRSVPSSQYIDVNVTELEKTLAFFKTEGFEILLSSCTTSHDETINLYLIHVNQKIVIKLFWLNTSSEQETGLFDDDDDDWPVSAGVRSMGLLDVSTERRGELSVLFNFLPCEKSAEFIKRFQSILTVSDKKENPNYVHIFEKDSNGRLKLSPYKVKPFELNVDEHYNEGFNVIDKNIVNWCADFSTLNKKLLLLHGQPGTGKTNYIKNLMAQNPRVRKIYIPPYYVSAITEPGFFGFIKNYSNSLLIIEDAEKVLLSRDADAENSAMSVLLNLTDGILSDILNFKIIATFNVDKDKIDTALTRPGRLHLCHEFKKLKKEKARALFFKLYGKEPSKDEELSIAEIFNTTDNGIEKKEERKIGFGF